MKVLIIECLNGATKAERAGLMLLMIVTCLAVVISIIAMIYWYADDIKRTAKYNALKFAFWCEDAADRFNKWNTLREDNADFTSISDWADYRKWCETKVPTWNQVTAAMLKGAIR